MIITRTPYRISFFGGGTDYKQWYEKFGGAVLTTTIDKYCYVCLRSMPAFLGSKYRVFWSKMETVNELSEIEHSGVRGCLQYLNIEEGIEVNHAGDLPARSGLGSSSAFTVGMLHALYVLRGDDLNSRSLANDAIEVEQDVLGETVGIQDQIQCAFGGFNHIEIDRTGNYHVNKVPIGAMQKALLESHLVIVFTELQRYASEIAAAQVSNVRRKQKQLERIALLVTEAVKAVEHPRAFGEMLHESWMLKRELSDKVTNPHLDAIYDHARSKGAYGGKVLGAGGGGFMLFCVPPERREAMVEALGLLAVPVRFEDHGSQVVLR